MNSPHQLAKYLATYINDRGTIASHVSREFAKRYTTADIDRMIADPPRKPTDSKPRQPSKLSDEPISMHRPISTVSGGVDKLALATNAYIAKHGVKIRKALGRRA
jgi:hypothetical protein